jgi:hypothetical protein
MRSVLKCAVGFSFAAIMVGCQQGPARIGVKGTVTYKGAKVADGWITFVPKEPDKGTQEAARITDGEYALGAANGLVPGGYRVAITASEPGAKPAPDMAPGAPRRVQPLIPEKYNRDSNLSIDVTVEGQREFDFNLD